MASWPRFCFESPVAILAAGWPCFYFGAVGLAAGLVIGLAIGSAVLMALEVAVSLSKWSL